ncbi:MAG: dihydroorotase [Halobacteriota archaeon]|uniref:dihydroorotase n=1 Tax=Natronomonas sp. TaxID=2184060 RepID=UPI003975EEBB
MLFHDATLADGRVRDVRVEGESIAEIGSELETSDESIDASGKLLLPGMIDAHVHFREPGFSDKETWETGARSAAAGGVTTVFDQPNTDPPTIDAASYEKKAEFAAESIVDYAINGGVTDEWVPDELLVKPLGALGEVFLADSTGEMGIGTDLFEKAVERAHNENIPVTVHAEDAALFDESVRDRTDADAWSAYRTAEAEIQAIEHACSVSDRLNSTVHIAHTSTPEGVDVVSEAGMTCEVSPHHLFLSRDDLAELGTLGRMNPPLRSENRRGDMFRRLVDGTIDIVATDHAPHTLEEKDAGIWDAPSGVPGVETALPLLLEQARRGRISYERVRDVTAANVAEIFDLDSKGRIEAGFDADLVLVDPDESAELRADELHSKCEWTPFEGKHGVLPELTVVRGTIVFRDGTFASNDGRNVRA